MFQSYLWAIFSQKCTIWTQATHVGHHPFGVNALGSAHKIVISWWIFLPNSILATISIHFVLFYIPIHRVIFGFEKKFSLLSHFHSLTHSYHVQFFLCSLRAFKKKKMRYTDRSKVKKLYDKSFLCKFFFLSVRFQLWIAAKVYGHCMERDWI